MSPQKFLCWKINPQCNNVESLALRDDYAKKATHCFGEELVTMGWVADKRMFSANSSHVWMSLCLLPRMIEKANPMGLYSELQAFYWILQSQHWQPFCSCCLPYLTLQVAIVGLPCKSISVILSYIYIKMKIMLY